MRSSWSVIAKFLARFMINANSDKICTTLSFQRQNISWFTLQESLSNSIWMLI